jgi:hypothetical protein
MANGKNKKAVEQVQLSNEYHKMGYPDLADAFIHAQNVPYRQKFTGKDGKEFYGDATTDKHFLEWAETEYYHGIKDDDNRMPFLNKYHQSDAGKGIYGDIKKVYDSGKRWTDDPDFMDSIKGRAWNDLPHYDPSNLREKRRYDPKYSEDSILDGLTKPDEGIY